MLTVRHNLAADPPPIPVGRGQVVFCRNVLIYFGHDDVVAFLDRLSSWLPAGAHLFLGYSESLWLVSDRFHLVRLGDAFVYRNGPAPEVTAPTRPAPAAASRPAPARVSAPRAAPRRPPPTPASADPAPSEADERELLGVGEAAMGAHDYAVAVTAFRKTPRRYSVFFFKSP